MTDTRKPSQRELVQMDELPTDIRSAVLNAKGKPVVVTLTAEQLKRIANPNSPTRESVQWR